MAKAVKAAPPIREGPNEEQTATYRRSIAAAQRMIRLKKAKDSLIEFTKLLMPDPADPDDLDKSRYDVQKHHEYIAAALEAVERGEIPRLIITMPPRSGKSELAAKKFIPWISGRDPYKDCIFATYSADFAEDTGRKVRDALKSKQFQQIFPGCKLKKGSSASDRLETEEGGILAFVGAGGAITGRGAHCLLSGTQIATSRGPQCIENLYKLPASSKVLAYDTKRRSLRWKKIKAVSLRKTDGYYRITTCAGRVVEATGEHPFFIDGQWRPAHSIAQGDHLLCAVPKADNQNGLRGQQVHKAWSYCLLLLSEVFRGTPCCEKSSDLHGVQPADDKKNVQVLPDTQKKEQGTDADYRNQKDCLLPELRHFIYKIFSFVRKFCQVLRPKMCESRAFHEDAVKRESWICAWLGSIRAKRSQKSSIISRGKEGNSFERFFDLCGLRFSGAHSHSSHQSRSTRQSLSESGVSVSWLSWPFARHASIETQGDSVALVEYIRKPVDVWNLQVEGLENFFANGILTHNCLIIDDPIKDREQADSASFRNKQWEWFNQVAMSRLADSAAVVLIIMTRWHEDDIVGRLTDPKNDCYSEDEAAKWKILELPALAREDDPMGRAVGESIWPANKDGTPKFPASYFISVRSRDPRGFSALYQGRPTPEEGVFFKAKDFQGYQRSEMPTSLRWYGASDHAVSEAQRADSSVLGCGGIDERGVLWIPPTISWGRFASDLAVEKFAEQIRLHHPLLWWAEKGHISKSIGPFLNKYLIEQKLYASIVEMTPAKDKMTRAQAIHGRISMGMVRFPFFADWWPDAKDQLLKFPNATHDDFVDWLAWLGIGLGSQVNAAPPRREIEDEPKPGTLRWLKSTTKWDRQQAVAQHKNGF